MDNEEELEESTYVENLRKHIVLDLKEHLVYGDLKTDTAQDNYAEIYIKYDYEVFRITIEKFG
jgi:hypothetical protein